MPLCVFHLRNMCLISDKWIKEQRKSRAISLRFWHGALAYGKEWPKAALLFLSFYVLCFCQPSCIMKSAEICSVWKALMRALGATVNCFLPHDSREYSSIQFWLNSLKIKLKEIRLIFKSWDNSQKCLAPGYATTGYTQLPQSTTDHNNAWSTEPQSSRTVAMSPAALPGPRDLNVFTLCPQHVQSVQCSKPWPLSLKATTDRPATSSSWERLGGPAHQIVSNSAHRI